MKAGLKVAASLLLYAALANANADAPPAGDTARGELLYTTHCIACHSAQVHWREKRLAADWTSLQAEVRRWQAASGLAWSDRDIAAVARYLNALHYRYPMPELRADLTGRP